MEKEDEEDNNDELDEENDEELIEETEENHYGKRKCDVCGIYYRHIYLRNDGRNRCKRCIRKEVTNKWYVPIGERRIRDAKDVIGSYNFTDTEKNALHRQFMSGGMSSEMAWKKVNYSENLLKWQKAKARFGGKKPIANRFRGDMYVDKDRNKKSIVNRRNIINMSSDGMSESNRKFIEGLRQVMR